MLERAENFSSMTLVAGRMLRLVFSGRAFGIRAVCGGGCFFKHVSRCDANGSGKAGRCRLIPLQEG